MAYKQDMVKKEGKGKYDITVPQPYEFQNQLGVKQKSIREQKVEQMIQDKADKEDLYKKFVFKANKIPRTTTEPLYQKKVEESEQRRQEVIRMSMAITKQNEKPFSFYGRDKNKVRDGGPPEIPEVMKNP